MTYWADAQALGSGASHAWRLNGNANDDAGANNGTASGITWTNPLWTEDTSSAFFERGTDNISFGTTSLNSTAVTAFTCSMLLEPTLDTLPFGLLSIGSDTSGLQMFLAGGMVPVLCMVSGSTATNVFSRALTINETSNVVFTYNAGTGRVFIDGRLITEVTGGPASITPTATTTTDPSTVRLGSVAHTLYNYSGYMSNVLVWDEVISDSDIFNTLFTGSASSKNAVAAFTGIPDKTEIRIFDRDASLAEVGTGLEYSFAQPTFDITYPVASVLNGRVVIFNTEDEYKPYYADLALPREGAAFPVNLLIETDRNYNNPGWQQEFPPTNTVAPSISGVGAVGELLTADNGSWWGTEPITYTYQWKRDGVNISGATSSTYTTVLADDSTLITCDVTATNLVTAVTIETNGIGLFPAGDIGQWLHTAGATPSTAEATLALNSNPRNDNTYYSDDGSAVTLGAGRFLILYQVMWTASGNNGRGNVVACVRHNTTNVPGSYGSGYQRDTANDAAWAAGQCIIDATNGDTIEIRHFRDTDSNVGSYSNVRSWLQVVKITDSNSFIHVDMTSQGAGAYDLASYQQVALDAALTTVGTNISLSGNQINLAANKSYLVLSGLYFFGESSRSSRFNAIQLDGSYVPGSTGYAYLRQAADEFGMPNSMCIVETGGTTGALTVHARNSDNNGIGTTNVSSAAQLNGANSGIFVLELPSTCDYFRSYDATAQQTTSTAQNLNIFRTSQTANSNIVSSNSNSSATLANTGNDLLVYAGIYDQRQSSNGTRMTRECCFRLNGTRQEYANHGNYNRGDQGSQDCYDATYNPKGIISPTGGEALTLRISKDLDSGWNDGGGTPRTEADEPPGFFAIDLTTI